jgi:serine/threonine-protein phosphatase CPPED1
VFVLFAVISFFFVQRKGVDSDEKFTRAYNRGYAGFSEANEKSWKGPFKFVCMADTQLGMATQDKDWVSEVEFMRKAVRHINTIRPRFVVVCGDLINAYPTKVELQVSQTADFKMVASEIRDDIPLVCVCGNHGT